MNRTKKWLIIGVLGFFLVATSILLTFLPNKNQQADEQANAVNVPVQYTGFKELSEYGITSIQMEGIKYSLFTFKPEAKKFAIDVATIKDGYYDRNNPSDFITMTFSISIDGSSPYRVSFDKYTDLTSIAIMIKDTSNRVVYNAGKFDSSVVYSAGQGD
jgi:hypothetical protein